jgi:3-oxoacyl-[acyl-carrier protein] reductase
MNLGIEGRVAIVCGASKGMGFCISKALALHGVKVLMIARDPTSLDTAFKEITAEGGVVETLAGDVRNPELAQFAVDRCGVLWGTVDILINNAGGPPLGSFLEHDGMAWEAAIQANLLSVVRFCKAVAPGMKLKTWGRIISITSTVAKEPSPAMVLSATTRAGVSAFSKALAIELAQFNISVNVICPGGVLTDRLMSLLQAKADRENKAYQEVLLESKASIPAHRFAEPNEIADVILFLASDRGGYINGVSLSVDGALTKAYT